MTLAAISTIHLRAAATAILLWFPLKNKILWEFICFVIVGHQLKQKISSFLQWYMWIPHFIEKPGLHQLSWSVLKMLAVNILCYCTKRKENGLSCSKSNFQHPAFIFWEKEEAFSVRSQEIAVIQNICHKVAWKYTLCYCF